MTFQEIKELSARTIREELSAAGVAVKKVILFGSQARNDAKSNSDWDFLVSVDRELSFSEKAVITTKIQSRLAEKHIPIDVVIKSESKLEKERGNVGFITYYALKDGINV